MTHMDALWASPAARFADAQDEVRVIAHAKVGREDAQLRLFQAYVPALRSAVSRYTRVLSRDDARQAAFMGLLSAVDAFDMSRSDRLASLLKQHVTDALASAASEATGGFTVPERSLKRFFGILARADGDVSVAAQIAPDHAMTVETFHTILAAVSTGSLDEATDPDRPSVGQVSGYDPTAVPVTSEREVADFEDAILVDIAFRAVDDVERSVCRLAYGFAEYDPQPDAEIGARLGMGRVKTLRTRQAALAKMRDAIGA